MKTKLGKFRALSSTEKRLLIEAYIRLGIMRAAILTVSFKRLTRSLMRLQDVREPGVDVGQLELAKAIGKAVRTAANNTPWESACLTQVLVAQRMLQKRGIGGVIYIGATMDSSNEEMLRAHAWLKSGGEFITGEEGRGDYTVLTSFGWQV